MTDAGDFTTPPHLADPSRALGVWYTEPPGVVARFLRRTFFTVPLAQWIAGPAMAGLRERFPGEQSFVFVLDLSLIDGRDTAVRQIVMDAVRPWAAQARRAAVVVPEDASRVYMASLRAAASLARIMGMTVSVASFPEAVRDLRVATRPARAGTGP